MFLGIGSSKTMNFVLDFSVCYIKVVTFSIEEYFFLHFFCLCWTLLTDR